jgi:hypothetical protein
MDPTKTSTVARFLHKLATLLYNYDSYTKSTRISFEDLVVTTYYWKNPKLILDIIEDECCLTSTGKNIVYAYYADDWEDVVDDVFNEVLSIINN